MKTIIALDRTTGARLVRTATGRLVIEAPNSGNVLQPTPSSSYFDAAITQLERIWLDLTFFSSSKCAEMNLRLPALFVIQCKNRVPFAYTPIEIVPGDLVAVQLVIRTECLIGLNGVCVSADTFRRIEGAGTAPRGPP